MAGIAPMADAGGGGTFSTKSMYAAAIHILGTRIAVESDYADIDDSVKNVSGQLRKIVESHIDDAFMQNLKSGLKVRGRTDWGEAPSAMFERSRSYARHHPSHHHNHPTDQHWHHGGGATRGGGVPVSGSEPGGSCRSGGEEGFAPAPRRSPTCFASAQMRTIW